MVNENESQTGQNMTKPFVGQPATYSPHSDCYPCTVVEVSKSEKTIKVQYDKYRVVSGHGNDGSAKYEILRDENGGIEAFSLRKNGRWVLVGDGLKNGGRLTLGIARRYYDPHF